MEERKYLDDVSKDVQDLVFYNRLAEARVRIELDEGCSEKNAQIILNGILYRLYQANPSIAPKREPVIRHVEEDEIEEENDENHAGLGTCKTCKEKVSKSAVACPHCGQNLPAFHVKCPKCSSSNIEVGKKGFGLGKAALGAIVLGPGGLLAGLHGRKNAELHCLSCGKKWKPNCS